MGASHRSRRSLEFGTSGLVRSCLVFFWAFSSATSPLSRLLILHSYLACFDHWIVEPTSAVCQERDVTLHSVEVPKPISSHALESVPSFELVGVDLAPLGSVRPVSERHILLERSRVNLSCSLESRPWEENPYSRRRCLFRLPGGRDPLCTFLRVFAL